MALTLVIVLRLLRLLRRLEVLQQELRERAVAPHQLQVAALRGDTKHSHQKNISQMFISYNHA